ncbi:MAG: hypothetical protein WBQ72_04805 [Terriglobales bacterium]
MACPYFVPREILNDGSWPHPARLPLGAGWTGECCAPEHEAPQDIAMGGTPSSPVPAGLATVPVLTLIRDFCNLGYATNCPHLPRDRDWDAVRFCVTSAVAEQITLAYACERDYAPIDHGTMTYDLRSEAWRERPGDPRITRLAASYVQAYRVRQRGALI